MATCPVDSRRHDGFYDQEKTRKTFTSPQERPKETLLTHWLMGREKPVSVRIFAEAGYKGEKIRALIIFSKTPCKLDGWNTIELVCSHTNTLKALR
jgi:hypothetical protein